MADTVLSGEEWLVRQSGFDLSLANTYETLFTVGNGRLGTRGTLEEGHVGNLPGTFLGGVYDSHDAPVIDLVTAPDWLDTAVFVDGVRLDVDTCRVVSHDRALDLRQGLLWRSTTFEDGAGRRTRLETLRCASMADRRICALRLEVTAENHSSDIEIVTGIEGRRRNLERLPVYPDGTAFAPDVRWDKWARTRHLSGIEAGVLADGATYLETRTIASEITLAYASATAFDVEPERRQVSHAREWVRESSAHRLAAGGSVRMEKVVAICTSRDVDATGLPRERCIQAVKAASAAGFEAIVAESAKAWARLWDACDCEVVGHPTFTQAVRFGIYHLLIAANPDDPTVNIGAKSLSGEGYRGHVFWDTEVMMLPFFILTQPATAKALLRYRHHTLDGARENSKEYGTVGARYAWESADTGREECPRFTPDGASRFWTREEEVHVSADVAYGVVKFAEATGDMDFLHGEGAEILFETSRFWMSRLERADGSGSWELRQIMGPDEFHSHVDNNAFTNRLVQWHLRCAADLYDELAREHPERLREVATDLALGTDEVALWREVASGIAATEETSGLIEQFEGYFGLKDVPITEWDANNMPKYPEGYHHFNCEGTTLLKQPDIVTLMFMLPDQFNPECKRANFEYYEARTLHKSSLSPSIHAIIGIEVGDPARAVQYFERSALVDLADNQGNTCEGMHIASAGGTWQVLTSGFGGLRVMNGQMTFNPWLPDEWEGVTFRITWRGRPIRVAVDHERVEFHLGGPDGATEQVVVRGEPVTLTAGQSVTVPLTSGQP